MRLASTAISISIALPLLACGDDTGTSPTTDTGSETTEPESTSDATTDESSTAPALDDTTTTAAPVDELEYARGIRLVRLAANQGVQSELVVDGIEVDPATHTARLVTGRRTLVRAFWSLHAEFAPRELLGRLTIDYPDGTQLVNDRPEMVEGESVDNGPSFQWLLEPEDERAGMRIRVQALEPDPTAATGEVSEPPPILPYAAALELPLHDAVLEMKVVLIPVLHQLDGCEQAPMPTEEDVEAIRLALEQHNALQSAEITVGEPMPYTDPIGGQDSGFSPVLAALAMRRESDAPADNVYYYGLLDSCDGFPSGLLGQALGIPTGPLPELASQRVSTGRWWGSGELASETLVHEVGHSQGRRHVRCSGGEGGPDLNYPHENGRIGVWGFGIHDFQLRAPSTGRDYMTYCSNEWVSDYGWEQTLDVIEVLTSWDYADVEPAPDGALVGVLHADGSATWWTARSGWIDEPTTDRIVWTIDGLARELPAVARALPDGTGTHVVAPLPTDFAAATSVRYDGAAGSRAITGLRVVYTP